MGRKLLSEGGPLGVKSLGNDRYSMSIEIPPDEEGRTARQCPDADCSPGYFKVKLSTNVRAGQKSAYCPYCGHSAEASDFATLEQLRYAEELVTREVRKGFDRLVTDALGLGASGSRKLGGGFLSIEVSYKPETHPPVWRPFEDEVRRDVTCPNCTLDQTVFGLATWCAGCGEDIFLVHVAAELAVTRLMLNDVPRRRELFGKRVAAKDLENCLEDAVSIFEASTKAVVRRALIVRGESQEQIEAHFKKIGNSFQNIKRTRSQLQDLFGFDLGSGAKLDGLSCSFEKRHPVTHNLGVIDRKYLERVQAAEREGREVTIAGSDVEWLLETIQETLTVLHSGLIRNPR